MRKQPTEAQKQAAKERRERFRALAKTVSDMTPEERGALAFKIGVRTIEGRELSPVNQCLLHMQFQGVSIVGGFQQWIRAGRKVCKGAKALSIWIHVGFGRQDGEATGAEIGETTQGESKRGFIMGSVFDISQTDATDFVERCLEETDAIVAGEVAHRSYDGVSEGFNPEDCE